MSQRNTRANPIPSNTAEDRNNSRPTENGLSSHSVDVQPTASDSIVVQPPGQHNVNTAGSQAGSDHNDQDDEGLYEDDPLENILQRIEILEEANRQKDDHIKLLYAEISMLKKDSQLQEERQNDIVTRSMNQNIVISGANAILEEKSREDCKGIVETIINDYIKTRHGSVTVIRAHRLGHSTNGSRPIVARLGGREEVSTVMKRSGTLAGTNIYVNPQYPQTVDERRSFIQSYRKNAKSRGATAKVSVDKLYVDNELCTDLLPPVIPPQVPVVLADLPLTSSTHTKENEHCRIQMSVAKTSSLEEVGNALSAVLLRSTSPPSGIVYAYRHTHGSRIIRNYESGSEPGLGTRLLKQMDAKQTKDKTFILYIWYKNPGSKARGRNFYELMSQCMDELE